MILIREKELLQEFRLPNGDLHCKPKTNLNSKHKWYATSILHFGMHKHLGALKGILQCLSSYLMSGTITVEATHERASIDGSLVVFSADAKCIAEMVEVQLVDAIFQLRQYGLDFFVHVDFTQFLKKKDVEELGEDRIT